MAPKRGTRQTAFKLPPDMLERVDRVAAWWTEERPGFVATRFAVVRELLARALADEERGRDTGSSPPSPDATR
jgi:hypothetical protein